MNCLQFMRAFLTFSDLTSDKKGLIKSSINMFICEAARHCKMTKVEAVKSENDLLMNLHISKDIGFDFLVF